LNKDALALVGAWGSQETELQSTLMDLIAGAVLVKLGRDRVTISSRDLKTLAEEWEIDRTVGAVTGFTISVRPRDPELPLKVDADIAEFPDLETLAAHHPHDRLVDPAMVLRHIDTFAGQEDDDEQLAGFVIAAAKPGITYRQLAMQGFATFVEWVDEQPIPTADETPPAKTKLVPLVTTNKMGEGVGGINPIGFDRVEELLEAVTGYGAWDENSICSIREEQRGEIVAYKKVLGLLNTEFDGRLGDGVPVLSEPATYHYYPKGDLDADPVICTPLSVNRIAELFDYATCYGEFDSSTPDGTLSAYGEKMTSPMNAERRAAIGVFETVLGINEVGCKVETVEINRGDVPPGLAIDGEPEDPLALHE